VADNGQSDRKAVGIRVLEAQPDLTAGLDDEQTALARKHAIALLDSLEAGPWRPTERYGPNPAAIGLLVIDGVLSRDVRIAGRWSSELLGPGDLLRPWDYEESAGDSIQSDSSWTVLQPARIAVLDERFADAALRIPGLSRALIARALRHTDALADQLAINAMTRIDDRLAALFCHAAERWGRVTPAGVSVHLPLTHRMLAEIVGAQRPSVTTALTRLHAAGVVTREGQTWHLAVAAEQLDGYAPVPAAAAASNGAAPTERPLSAV
jgi:CRP/FNR family transcriptional regulator, cyclic AMP receptor protein